MRVPVLIVVLSGFLGGRSIPARAGGAGDAGLEALPPAIDIVQLSEEEQAIPPQPLTGEQAAVVLFEVAERFEMRGELSAARLLYREIIDRYGETVQASRAMERLNAIEGRPDFGPGPGGAAVPPAATGTTPTPPAQRQPPGGKDQSGRFSVIFYSTLLAGWVALAIPIYAEAEGPTGYGFALLLGIPAGLLGSMYLTKDRQVTAQQADIYVLGGNMGLWHGLALGLIFEWEDHEVAGATALGGAIGAVTGALIVAPGRTRETSAALSSLAAPYGIWYGTVLSQMLDSDEDLSEDPDKDEDTMLGSMLIGGDAALIGSAIMGPRMSLSRDRGRLIGLSGAVGALAGAATGLIFDVDDNAAWGIVGAGTTGGLIAGVALTAEYDQRHGFDDPPRGAVEDEGDADLAFLPLHLRALKPAGPSTARWRESLRISNIRQSPSFGVTVLEARF